MRRKDGEVRNDFLQTLLWKHAGNDADKLMDSQLKDNNLTLPMTGNDMTTESLMWFIKFHG
uniref:Uncharacterized protein n=1 Tax=Arundo donax TaxID=35708 RepID=A0A0A9CFJ4_ARUDO